MSHSAVHVCMCVKCSHMAISPSEPHSPFITVYYTEYLTWNKWAWPFKRVAFSSAWEYDEYPEMKPRWGACVDAESQRGNTEEQSECMPGPSVTDGPAVWYQLGKGKSWADRNLMKFLKTKITRRALRDHRTPLEPVPHCARLHHNQMGTNTQTWQM